MAIYKISYNVRLDFRPYIPTEGEYLFVRSKLDKNKKFLLNHRYKPVKLKQKHPFFWFLMMMFLLALSLLILSTTFGKIANSKSVDIVIEAINMPLLYILGILFFPIAILSFNTDVFYANEHAQGIWLSLLDPYFKGEQRISSQRLTSMSHLLDNYEGFKYFLSLDYEKLVMKYNSELQKPH
jgi:hypothetical protein